MKAGLLVVILGCMTMAAPAYAATEKHVQSIIDSSISLRRTGAEPANDASAHAPVASVMFYDLARYDLGPDGSFKVRSFDASIGPPCPGSVPKSVADDWKVPGGSRDLFVQSILRIPYDAPCTYF